MSARVKGFTVTLEHDLSEDDANEVRLAIAMVKGVLSVQPVEANPGDFIIRQRLCTELWNTLSTSLAMKAKGTGT